MRIYFCPECGAYSAEPSSVCEECFTQLPEDSWAEITDEELQQLEYIEEFDLPPGIPIWEYEVVRLKPDTDLGGLTYDSELLNRMGEKGWELVNIVSLGDGTGPRYGVFKRSWATDDEE